MVCVTGMARPTLMGVPLFISKAGVLMKPPPPPPSITSLTYHALGRSFVRSLARLVTQSYLITDFKKYIGGGMGGVGEGKRHLVDFTYARAII